MTVKEHLNTLKEPYKTKALNNLDGLSDNKEVSNLLKALSQAFIWSETKEGYSYWSHVYSLIEGGIDPIFN